MKITVWKGIVHDVQCLFYVCRLELDEDDEKWYKSCFQNTYLYLDADDCENKNVQFKVDELLHNPYIINIYMLGLTTNEDKLYVASGSALYFN